MATQDKAIAKHELPERVKSTSAPENAVSIEDLVNGNDVVILGSLEPIETSYGVAHPVAFMDEEAFREYGPPEIERHYDPNGEPFVSITGHDAWQQFLTSSTAVMRVVKKVNEQGPRVARVETQHSRRTGYDYYVLV